MFAAPVATALLAVLTAITLAFILTGCATYTTTQRDKSPDRDITTEVTVRTFFDSNSRLANSEAAQNNSSQRAKLGSLAQDSSSTNLVSQLEALAAIARAVRPTP